MFNIRARLPLLAACLGTAAACGRGRRAPADQPVAAPAAEFLVATQDSTYWVRSTASGVRVRGAPLLLARFDGRFYEIFVADDDRSYEDAILVGERLYRRDLSTGDSAVMFSDSVVPHLAKAYARAHPGEQRLGPDDEGNDDASTQATAEIDVLAIDGPYLSYEYRVDTQLPDGGGWHGVRHGVVDLRSGRRVAIRDLLPDSAAARVLRAGRLAYRATLDSIARDASSGDERAARARELLRAASFDATSFALVDADTAPAVEFAIPDRTDQDGDEILTLPAIPASFGWWSEMRPELPEADGSGAGLDRWRRSPVAGYDVIARYDSSRDVERLTLADRSMHEWPISSVTPPVQRIYWLDTPPVDAGVRHALARAFNDASLYDEDTRTVRAPAGRSRFAPRVVEARRVLPRALVPAR